MSLASVRSKKVPHPVIRRLDVTQLSDDDLSRLIADGQAALESRKQRKKEVWQELLDQAKLSGVPAAEIEQLFKG